MGHSAYPWYDDTGEDWPFCECGTTLLGEDQCETCAASPHDPKCWCDECRAYWDKVADDSKAAADRANRRLVCSCGWTGAFIEHHNSEAYGPVARPVHCVITHRDPKNAREQLTRKVWTGREWRHFYPTK